MTIFWTPNLLLFIILSFEVNTSNYIVIKYNIKLFIRKGILFNSFNFYKV